MCLSQSQATLNQDSVAFELRFGLSWLSIGGRRSGCWEPGTVSSDKRQLVTQRHEVRLVAFRQTDGDNAKKVS